MSRARNPLRQALWPLGLLYGLAAAVRNWTFDAGLRRVHRLDVPVYAVGNLTVGGTGKTPTVLWLCQQLRAAGRHPGVLARGYGRARGARLNDEGEMLQRALPWLQQEQDPDRTAGGRRLQQKGVDCIVLDDGFQHRRLHRDVNLLCMDAARPFADGQLLPAGDLREWRAGVGRATAVLLTRAGTLDDDQLAARVRRLRELAGNDALPIWACEHAPSGLVGRPAGTELPAEHLRGRRVVLLSALARPQAFADTVKALGAEVVAEQAFRDHHRFTASEVAAAAALARRHDAVLLTTAKDDVRLPADGPERLVLQIALAFRGPQPSLRELGIR